MSDDLRVEQRPDGVRHLELHRPEAKNAISIAMREDLVAAVREARGDPAARALLITGAGDAFCSGMDLRESTVKDAGRPGFDPRSTSETLRAGIQLLVRELWEMDKPTVAAVHGVAVGPGAHIALACDFVVTSPTARFVWSFPRWGLVADAGGAYLLPRLVGMARAKEMVLLGGEVYGADAVDLGLASRCVDDAVAEASALAARLAAMPTRALGLSKRLLNTAFESDLSSALEAEGHYQALATTTDDLVEGMASFREKRDPDFQGR